MAGTWRLEVRWAYLVLLAPVLVSCIPPTITIEVDYSDSAYQDFVIAATGKIHKVNSDGTTSR